MKFAQHLSSHQTPEWLNQYIQYETMKTMLYKARDAAVGMSAEEKQDFYLDADEDFLKFCGGQLTMMCAFYSEKLSEARRRLTLISDSLEPSVRYNERIRRRLSSAQSIVMLDEETKLDRNLVKSFKLALSELYLMLVLLQNYQDLNITGFRKILKKHDKVFVTDRGLLWREENVLNATFATDDSILDMVNTIERLFTIYLENGDRAAAMKRLRVPAFGVQPQPLISFRLGLLLGFIISLSFGLIYASIQTSTYVADVPWDLSFRLYRSFVLSKMQLCLIGLNMIGWSNFGVNHVLIFELDPRSHLSYQQMLEIGFSFVLLLEISYACFLICIYFNSFALVNPLILFLATVLIMINPSKKFYRKQRQWFGKALIETLLPILQPVRFCHFWIGDQLNSDTQVFYDLFGFFYFYAFQYEWKKVNGSQSPEQYFNKTQSVGYAIGVVIFSLVPHVTRFVQCIKRFISTGKYSPHLTNAGKYFSSFPAVVIFIYRSRMVDDSSGTFTINIPFTITVLIFMSVEAVYKLVWDLGMDWSLMDIKAPYPLLRDHLVYSPVWLYYFVIVQNIILRFTYLIRIGIVLLGHIKYDPLASFIFSALEVYRRFVWNYLRLENEHINNCGEFRAVRDISIAPSAKRRYSRLNKQSDTTSNGGVVTGVARDAGGVAIPNGGIVGVQKASKSVSYGDQVFLVDMAGVSGEANEGGPYDSDDDDDDDDDDDYAIS